MSIELLKEASASGVSLFLSSGKLKVRANKGALTDDLRRRILDAREAITALLEELGGMRAEDGSEAIKPALRRDERLPLSFQQQRLWVLNELQPGNVDYNMPFAFRIRGGFSLARAQSAIDGVVARHEVLRTSFHRDDDGIYQRCHGHASVEIVRHDLTDLLPGQQDEAVRRLMTADAAVPFDLERVPLIRVAWMDLSADEGVLYFNLHHIVFDGWSVDILLREFVTFYTAEPGQSGDAVMPLSIQYADYAVWQRQRLNDERLDEHAAYWMRVLDGAPAVHPLPLDHERPRIKQHRGESVRGLVGPEHLARLHALAQELDVTLFMLLHGALSVVLARYGADPDIIVGTPVANRNNSQLDELIGFFINTLVLRVSCDETQTVRDYFRHVREVNLGAQTHQDVPFEMLIDKLNVPRSTAHSPLFQVMLSLDNNVRTAHGGGAFDVQPVNVGIGQAKYDLTLNVGVGPAGLELNWVYDAALFKPATIQHLDEHLSALLSNLVGDADRQLHMLESMAADERTFLLNDLVGPDVAIDLELLPDRHVATTARQQPDAIALHCDGEVVSYGELDRQIDYLAHLLATRGVKHQDRIGIVLPPSPAMVVAVLACLRIGAVYVPIDPAATQKKVDHIIGDSGIRLLLTVSTLPDFTRANGVQASYLDEVFGRDLWRSATSVAPVACGAADLAYVLYTSGSTGQPKGVAITRQGLCNYLGHCLHVYARESFDEAVLSSPLTFDATITTLFTPLICGRSLRILRVTHEALAHDLSDLMLGSDVPRLFKLTPAHLDLLVRYWREQGETRSGQAAALVVIGGEQLLKKTLEPFLDRLAPHSAFVNEYGPTETVVGCCTYVVRSKADLVGDAAVVPIGRPIQNTRLQLFQGRRLAPLGATGELFIAGAGVARGYLNQPELQERHFVMYEVANQLIAFYRTGDQVRYGAERQLMFVGRHDEQIKLRGYRIEPAEIEACLCAFAGIREACVLLSEQLATPSLVAYVVADGAVGREEALAAQLRAWCQAGLSAPYVPAVFKFLTRLPTTVNGKVDKRALAALPLNLQPAASYVMPETPMQQALSGLFAGLLKRERVGITDNFFALGGDSILAIQAVSRAKKAGLRITTQQIFEHQTIAELSRVAVQLSTQTVGVETAAEVFELTPIQQWFVRNQPQALHHYNQSLFLEAPADLNAGMLDRIAEALLRRHDVLRSKFMPRDGAWKAFAQVFDSGLLLKAVAVEALPEGVEEGRSFISSRCNHYQASFNLETGPLFKIVLFQGERAARVLILAHHMVVDAVSWRILLEDFERAYRQLAAGEVIALGDRGTSYQYWSGLLTRRASSDDVGQERAYWLKQWTAGNFDFREFAPADPPTVASNRQVSVELSAEDTSALLTHANAPYATRTQELLLAAVYLGLRPWAKSDAFVVDLEGHGREALEANLDLSETLGWFTAMYPHVLRGHPGDPGATLRAVKEDVRAIPGGGIGFGLLKYLAGEPGLQCDEQSPHIVFNYLGQLDKGGAGQSAFALANEDAGAQIAPQAPRAHRLAVTAFAIGGRLRLTLDYSHAEYSEETATAIAQSIVSGAQALIGHCSKQVARVFTPSDFPLTSISAAALERLQALVRIDDLYPSTPMQRGMLAANELDRSAYVTQFYPMLRGALDPSVFVQAWQAVVEKYAALRTRFVVEEGVQYQLVSKVADAKVSVVDLGGLDEGDQQLRFRTLCEQERNLGFTGAEPALYRMTLVRLAADRHRILFTCHHSVFDGWSMPLVFNQLLRNIKQLRQGEDPVAVAEPDYGSYVAWLSKQDAAQAIEAWRNHLASQTPPAGLKLPRPSQHVEPAHAIVQEVIGAEQTHAIREFARAQGVTLNTLVQFAWALVLKAYSGTSDVTFGAVVSGRPHEVENVDNMVGLFINTIPVRVRIGRGSPGPQLNELQKTFHDLNRHAFLAYSEIKRTVGRNPDEPLFESVVDFKNYPINEHATAASPDELVVDTPDGYGTNNFDITLIVGVYEKIMFNCSYRSDRYEAGCMAQMLGYLSHVLGELARGRAVEAIGPTPAMPAAGDPQWAPDDAAVPMHRSFERVVATTPERIALSCGHQTLNFAQLDAQANRIARRLMDCGVVAGEPVGLMLGRGVSFVAGVLGIFKSGAAYVPIDPAYPDERRQYMIEDSGLEHLLCDHSSRMTSLSLVQQHLLDEPGTLAGFSGDPVLEVPLAPSSLAYVIYTSGSTGRPKGVMVEHRNLRNLADGMRALGMDGSGCWAAVASFSFDASLQGLCHLMQGGHLVVLTDEEKVDAQRLRQCVEQHRVTVLDCTPTLLESWLEQGAEDFLPSLVIGGEAISEPLWRRLAGRHGPGLRHFNAYGPTECTVNASMALVEGDRPHIGRCLANTFGVVLDAEMNLCPPGVAGELYLGGRGVGRGYFGNPELTAQRFVSGLLSGYAGRLYRTGDAARQWSDGNFEYLGRLDEQVKINGYRIELDEIAAVLDDHPAVESALVLAAQAESGRTQLVACVRHNEAVEAGRLATELAAWLRQRLPAYMQPARFVITARWPMTGNGKIDRDLLLSMPSQHVTAGTSLSAQTPVQQRLCELFASVLVRESVGPDDNFYALGGDSILAIRLVAKAAKGGLKFTIKQLTTHPTVRELASVCQGDAIGIAPRSTALQLLLCELFASVLGRVTVGIDDNFYELGGDSILAIRLVAKSAKRDVKFTIRQLSMHPTVRALAEVCEARTSAEAELPVSGLQVLLPIHHEVIVEQLHVGPDVFDHFNGGSLFGLPPGFDESTLPLIHAAMLRRHDALRLAFDIAGRSPSATYLPADAEIFRSAAAVERISEEVDIPAAVKAICVKHQNALRLADGGLFKLVLIRAHDLDRLLMLAHHAVVDVVSWHVLVADLGEAVHQCLRGKPVRLSPKSSAYQAWGEYLAESARNGTFAGERDYWRAQLNTDRLAAVTLNKNVVACMGHRRNVPVVLDGEATSALLLSAKSRFGADINTVLLSALYRGLTRWQGASGFRFLLESHGRHSDAAQLDLSETVGWFTQAYPLLLDFEITDPETDVAVVGRKLAGVPHQGLGYGVLRFLSRDPALLPPAADGAVFQVLFNYLGQFNSIVGDAGALVFRQEDIGASTDPRMPTTAPLGFQGGVYGGKLAMNVEFDTRHFSVEAMQRLATLIHGELIAIIDAAHQREAELVESEIH